MADEYAPPAAEGPVSDEQAKAALNRAAQLNRSGHVFEASKALSDAVHLLKLAPSTTPEQLWSSEVDLGTMLNKVERSERAIPILQDALEQLSKVSGPNPEKYFETYWQLAVAYGLAGREEEAAKAAAKARDAGSKLPKDGSAKQVYEQANFLYSQGKVRSAEKTLRKACDLFRSEQGEGANFAICLHQLSTIVSDGGERLRLLETAVSIRGRLVPAGDAFLETAVSRLLDIYLQQGRLEDAEPLHKEYIDIFETNGRRELGPYKRMLYNLAVHEFRLGKVDEAEIRFGDLVLLCEQDKLRCSSDVRDDALAMLGVVKIAKGKSEEALPLLERRTADARSLERQVTGQEKRHDEEGTPTFPVISTPQAIQLLVSLYAGRDAADPLHVDEAFRAAQTEVFSEAGNALAAAAARSTGQNEVASLVREWQDLHGQQAETILDWGRATDSRASEEETEAVSTRAEQIEGRLSRIEKELKRLGAENRLEGLTAASVGEIRKHLGADDVLLYYFDVDTPYTKPETFVWTITKKNQGWTRLQVGPKELGERVAALRATLVGSGGTRGAKSIRRRTERRDDLLRVSAELFQVALAPALAGRPSTGNLIVIPSASLAALPLQTLITSPGMTAADDPNRSFSTARWLIRDYSVSVVPTVSSFVLLNRLEAATQDNPKTHYLGIGNPLIAGPSGSDRRAWKRKGCRPGRLASVTTRGENRAFDEFFSSEGVKLSAVQGMSPLPETVDELCAVAADLDGDAAELLMGRDATETRLKAMSVEGGLERMGVVHFAAHGLISGDFVGLAEPALVMTPPASASPVDDGLLTASEVSELRLGADWIILSACNTAAGSASNKEPFSGLARAFFYAGARSLLVSNWPVNSQAAVELITETAGNFALDPRSGKAGALRRAMLSLIDEGGEKSDPLYWAPFTVVGESTRTSSPD